MSKCTLQLTVFFEDSFYKGVFEYQENGCYQVAFVIFGQEPKGQEVYEMILSNFKAVLFHSSLSKEKLASKHSNPKRQQRMIARKMQEHGVGTKAMQVMKEQYQQTKLARKVKLQKRREEQQKCQFRLRQEKRKQKHRGH